MVKWSAKDQIVLLQNTQGKLWEKCADYQSGEGPSPDEEFCVTVLATYSPEAWLRTTAFDFEGASNNLPGDLQMLRGEFLRTDSTTRLTKMGPPGNIGTPLRELLLKPLEHLGRTDLEVHTKFFIPNWDWR